MPNQQEEKKQKVDIVYYTDPLCCWSWVFEPVIQQLRTQYNLRYCMAGMLASWESYHDTLNAVTRPIQMGPVWLQAKQMSGIPLNDKIWFKDPPASSYPACVAVKCAAMQSAAAEEMYLARLREAVMLNEQNIAKKEVLLAIAKEVPLLDIALFEQQLSSEQVLNAFKADLQETQYRGIKRFPSLLITVPGKKTGVLLTGNRPLESIIEAINQLN
jgi:putative protein-disulfide isomerase